jgi:hypothetical protein
MMVSIARYTIQTCRYPVQDMTPDISLTMNYQRVYRKEKSTAGGVLIIAMEALQRTAQPK